MNYQRLIDSTSDLSGKWWELMRRYEMFWRRVESENPNKTLEKEFAGVKAKEDELVKKEAKLPQDMKLLRKCQYEVLHTRGLSKK